LTYSEEQQVDVDLTKESQPTSPPTQQPTSISVKSESLIYRPTKRIHEIVDLEKGPATRKQPKEAASSQPTPPSSKAVRKSIQQRPKSISNGNRIDFAQVARNVRVERHGSGLQAEKGNYHERFRNLQMLPQGIRFCNRICYSRAISLLR
jgi:hypothetical protein